MPFKILKKIMLKIDIAEIYSPPRVIKEARAILLSAGEAMDLTAGWNFSMKADREHAEAYNDKHRPLL